MDLAADLLDVLYRQPTLVEAVMGGLTSLNLVSKYIPGRFRVPFASALEGIRIMTGSTCGLLQYAEKGSVPPCDQIGGFPVPGIPLPRIPGMPNLNLACLQGMEMNGDENGSGENATESATAPPSQKKVKRETSLGEQVENALEGDATAGACISARSSSGNGAPGSPRKKRSLIVGKKINF